MTDPVRVVVPDLVNGQGLRALERALDEAFFGRSASRVVVLQGGPEVFCEGLDLAGLSASSGAGDEDAVRRFARCLERIATAPKPVIAVVEGAATGGGVGLAAACGLVLAAPRATFALTELLFGLLPAVIGPYLRQRISAARLRAWGLGAATWTAEQALEYGLADAVAEDAAAARQVAVWARALSRPPAEAVGPWKALIAAPALAAAGFGARTTAERLHDPAVRGAIRRFVAEGEVPWLARR
jgi:enoyl-CoA hydratase/carnithine racemase